MASSAIRHIVYKSEPHELSVWFGPDNRRYKYFNVPETLYQELRDAPSRGQFFNARIRGHFECQRITASPLADRRWQALKRS